MKLSFCMIVKDEAASLGQCLDSVRSVVDEMVVMDTGSADRTIAIAESYGAIVPTFTWGSDFSAARNAALQYVTGDWVLVLDADEVLHPEIIPALRQAIQDPNHLVVNLVRQEVGAAQSPYSLVSRLFRRHPEVHFTRPYHAMVDDSVEQLLQREPNWKIVSLPEIAILHYGYQTEVIATKDKFNKARTTMAGFLAANPNDPYVCSKLGALYAEIGETAMGLELLQRGLQFCTDNPATLYELHYHLGSLYAELDQPQAADAHYQAAAHQPILPKLKLGALNNWGTLRQAHGDLAAAQALYEQALAIDPTLATAHYNLGMALKEQGQLAPAIEHYQQAIVLQPDYAEAHQNLGVALLKAGSVVESLDSFGRAIGIYEQRGEGGDADRLRQGLQELGFTVHS